MKERKMGNNKIGLPEIMIVISVLMLFIFGRMTTNPIESDEFYWISSSAYFEDWITFDTTAESWQVNHMTLSGPALPKYLIAIGRLLGGFQPDNLNKPYNYSISYDANIAEGRVPSDKLLFSSRTPMGILSVLLGGLFYAFMLHGINRFTAIFWLILFISNDALNRILPLAMSEAPLIFFSFLSVIFVLRGQNHLITTLESTLKPQGQNSFYKFYILAGVCVGLAAASKIHGFFLLITFGILLLYILFIPKYSITNKIKITYLIRIFSVFSLSALFVFILLNPFIYTNPVTGVGWMFQYRLMDMSGQSQQDIRLTTLPLIQRWGTILYNLMTSNASIRGNFGLYINTILALLGSILIVRAIVNAISKRMPFDLICTTLLYFSIMVISAFMSPLDWLRYFLYPIFAVTLILSFSTNYLFEKIKQVITKRIYKTNHSV